MTWKKGQSGNPNGRPKGKLNQFAQETAKQIAETGELPVIFLASVYQDVSLDMKLRIDAARAAAPYAHPRLATSEVDLNLRPKEHQHEYSDEELLKIIADAQGDKAA